VKLSVSAKTALHDFAINAVGIVAAGLIFLATATPIIGGVVGAILAVVIHAGWPSAKARADRRAMADLRRQVDDLASPRRLVENAEKLERMRRFGPRWPGDR
jgi:hypothetical protein